MIVVDGWILLAVGITLTMLCVRLVGVGIAQRRVWRRLTERAAELDARGRVLRKRERELGYQLGDLDDRRQAGRR